MGTDDRILAVDLGTSGVKVALAGVKGELVASAGASSARTARTASTV